MATITAKRSSPVTTNAGTAVDVVELTNYAGAVEVLNVGGGGYISFTVDGLTTPTAGAAETYTVPAAINARMQVQCPQQQPGSPNPNGTTVQVITSASTTYQVSVVPFTTGNAWQR